MQCLCTLSTPCHFIPSPTVVCALACLFARCALSPHRTIIIFVHFACFSVYVSVFRHLARVRGARAHVLACLLPSCVLAPTSGQLSSRCVLSVCIKRACEWRKWLGSCRSYCGHTEKTSLKNVARLRLQWLANKATAQNVCIRHCSACMLFIHELNDHYKNHTMRHNLNTYPDRTAHIRQDHIEFDYF